MKKYRFEIVLSILVSILLLLLANTIIKKRDKGSAISNRESPKFKNIDWELIPGATISIDDVKTDDYLYEFRDITISPTGNILLLTNNSILKLTKAGKVLDTFKIKRGEGPGELRMVPGHIYLDNQGNIYLPDGYKVVKLDENFNFKNNINILVRENLCIDKKGYLYTMERESSRTDIHMCLSKFDGSGNLIKMIVRVLDRNTQSFGGILLTKRHYYSPATFFCISSDSLVFASNLEYKLFRYSFDGKLQSTINVNEKPQKISSREKDKIERDLKNSIKSNVGVDFDIYFPKHRPFFKKILIDEKDRLYVIRLKPILEPGSGESIDVFSKGGELLYRVSIPFVPRVIKGGYIYFIETTLGKDDDYIYKVKSFKIKEVEK